MIFAGFTSAYIVQQGGAFWVNIAMPDGFMWSTIFTALSSILLFIGLRALKNEQHGLMKASLFGAFVFGLLFGIFQFKGFTQLYANGSAIVGPIVNVKGRYGDYYTLYFEQKEIGYDNGKFYHRGEEITPEFHAEMKAFCQSLYDGVKHDKPYNLENYGTGFMLKYEGELVTYLGGQLQIGGQPLNDNQRIHLEFFTDNIIRDIGDFIMRGEYGKDFWIYYQGEKLEYEHRTFYLNGRELSEKQQDDLFSQNNQASSYIYVFVGIHLLHWLGGIIALLVISIKGLQMKYTKTNYLGLTLGSVYWHFLGILWLYLYAFLILIH